jgi:YegS/Rv2252/BmrU family lipid kinase
MNPDTGYITLIINPRAGARSKKHLAEKFIEYLKQRNFKLQIHYTTHPNHAKEIAADVAVKYDCQLVVVAGGDGTIRETVSGLEGCDKPLMLLPCGTENLLANELGYRFDFKTAVKVFEAEIQHPLDLCKANDRFFTSVGGAGFDGDVVKLVDAQRKGNITHLHYFKPILQSFMKYDFPKFTVEADDEIIFKGRGFAIFGSISRYAVGLPILQKADYGDGLLDICIYKCKNHIGLLYHSLMTVLKRHRKSKDVIYKQCKKLKIYSDVPMTTELDGDPGPDMPLEITILPQAVKVLIPPHSKPVGMRTRMLKIFK